VLYVGFYSQNNGIYATTVSSPTAGSSSNPFTIMVPTGTWQEFAILDQNNDGIIDVGDVTNTGSTENGPPTVTISGSGTQNVSLPSANLKEYVQTVYQNQTSYLNSQTNSSIGYNLNFILAQQNKLPVAITLTSGPNVIFPVDMSNEACNGCGTPQFKYGASLFNGPTAAALVPNVGDTYGFTVTYSDGSVDSTVTGQVAGWNDGSTVVGQSDTPTNLLPNGSTGPSAGTRTQPTFTWTDSSSAEASSDYYSFYIYQQNGSGNIWQIPGQNSKSNGFSSSTTSLTWGTDPTGGGSTPTQSSLTTGDVYNWQIQVTDSNGNEAHAQTYYIP
jgi:hypothetical protein